MIGKFFLKCLVVLLFIPTLMFSQELEFTASIDRQKVPIDGRVQYQVHLSGADLSNLPEIQLPDFKGRFSVISSSRSHSYSIINGQVSASEVRTFVLMPVKVGNFVIDSASIVFAGQTFRTNTLMIEVVDATISSGSSPSTSQPNILEPQNSANDSIFTAATVNKQVVYVGEKINYSLRLFRRIRLWSDIQFNVPSFTGFKTRDVSIQDGEYVESLNGRSFHVKELLKKEIYPIEPGVFTIDQAKVGFVVNPFDGQRVIQSQPIEIEVTPLPDKDSLNNFSGAVGEFELEGAVVTPKWVQFEPITVKVQLTGNGNFSYVEGLFFEPTDNFNIYKPKAEDSEQGRIFEYIVVPKKSGELSLPTFSLTYFSPIEGDYKVVETPEIEGVVLASQQPSPTVTIPESRVEQEVKLLKQDLRYLKAKSSYTSYRYFWETIFSVVFLVLNLIPLLFFLGKKIRVLLFKENLKVKQKKQVYKESVKKLKEMMAKDKEASLSEVQNIFLDYISVRFGESALGLQKENFKDLLLSHNCEEQLVSQTLSWLEAIDFAVFAPSHGSVRSKRELCEAGIELMKRLQKAEVSR